MLNEHKIIGRVGKDPEVRHLESGSVVANFSVATSESYKDRTTGEKVENTEWINVVLWKGLAEVAEKYVKKGDLIYVSGKSVTRSWEKDGVTRYTTELVGRDMKMLGSKGSGGSERAPAPTQEPVSNVEHWAKNDNSSHAQTPAPTAEDATDDLPF